MINNTNPQYTINNTKGLATRAVMKTKISLIENKIPDDSSLVTTSVVNTKLSYVENKIPHHARYITTEEFNNSRAENFAARLKQANLVRKTDLIIN